MLQIKTFKISESQELINKWLKENYSRIEMRADGKGPALSVYGNTDPVLMVQYDSEDKGSVEYYKSALEEEISLRKISIFKSIQQLEEHRAKRNLVPRYKPQKGKHQQEETELYKEHSRGVEATKRDILLQKANLQALQKVFINLKDAVGSVFTDDEKTMTSPEVELAERTI